MNPLCEIVNWFESVLCACMCVCLSVCLNVLFFSHHPHLKFARHLIIVLTFVACVCNDTNWIKRNCIRKWQYFCFFWHLIKQFLHKYAFRLWLNIAFCMKISLISCANIHRSGVTKGSVILHCIILMVVFVCDSIQSQKRIIMKFFRMFSYFLFSSSSSSSFNEGTYAMDKFIDSTCKLCVP